MPTFRCSMFGHILYDDNLTYQELLETEEKVMEGMKSVLAEYGAQHFDFTPQADSLRFECVFTDMDRTAHHGICDSVIQHLGSAVLARFSFMDKEMDTVGFYFLGRGKWREELLSIPGPKEALSGWKVRQVRKSLNDNLSPARLEKAMQIAVAKEAAAEKQASTPKPNKAPAKKKKAQNPDPE